MSTQESHFAGPFPNLRNQLEGVYNFQKRSAGFKDDAPQEEGLCFSYEKFTDGRDKVSLVYVCMHACTYVCMYACISISGVWKASENVELASNMRSLRKRGSVVI
jgi:hypothetical protein